MSLIKRYMEELETRPWMDTKENVCPECFTDDGIQEYIKNNASEKKCDYCDKSSTNNIAIPLAELMDHIVSRICTEYSDPNNAGVMYNSREGGWQISTIDNQELLLELDITENDTLLNDIANNMYDDVWCDKNPYETKYGEQCNTLWSLFCSQVKHQTRFMFFNTKTIKQPYDELHYFGEPYEILDVIGKYIIEGKLIETIKIGTQFIRTRANIDSEYAGKPYDKVSQLCPPPAKLSCNGRMNPVGISMFYCAKEEKTALEEIKNKEKPNINATVAIFENIKELQILDFTKFKGMPSLFGDNYKLRQISIFIDRFINEISAPYNKSNKVDIDYIPTQIVTEYIFQTLKLPDSEIHGIAYKSARNSGGTCYVFNADMHFFEGAHNECQNWFRLLNDSIKLVLLDNDSLS